MTIQSERRGKSVVMLLDGRLDTATAPQFERKVKQWGYDINELVLDLSGLTYISSMGLRVLLRVQKIMNDHEQRLVIKNMGEPVREVFEMTGFIKLLVEEEKFVVIRKEDEGPDRIRLCLIGRMNPENASVVHDGLFRIREENLARDADITVILDAEKLESLTESASRILCKAVEDTGWERRKLTVQNAAEEIRRICTGSGLDWALA